MKTKPPTNFLLSAGFLSAIVTALSPNGAIQIKIGMEMPYALPPASAATVIDRINAVFLRIDQLNNQNSSLIASNVQLVGVWNNPGTSKPKSISGAFSLVNQPVAALIGSGQSGYTTLSAYISNVGPNGPIPQCDGSSTSPSLSNKELYPTFFRTIPSDSAAGIALAGFVYSNNWAYVATVFTDDAYGSGLNSAFVTAARNLNITIATQQQLTFSSTGISDVSAKTVAANIKSLDARIVLFFGYYNDLYTLLKEAKRAEIYGDGYAWISSDSMASITSKYPDNLKDFTGLLYFFPKERTSNPVADGFDSYFNANRTSDVIKAQYTNAYPGDTSISAVKTTPASYVYFFASCVDAIALYIDAAVNALVALGLSRDSAIQQIASGNWSLNASGSVSFFTIAGLNNYNNILTPTGYLNYYASSGDRLGDYNIKNFDATGLDISVGTYVTSTNSKVLEGASITWPGGGFVPPKDRIDPDSIAVYIAWSDPIGKLSLSLFVIGMTIWTATMIGYLYYSKERIIRQSAFLVGLFMQLCLFVGYFELLAMIGTPTTLVCVADSFIIPVAFSLYYGLLFTKNLRIYKIFNSTAGGKFWSDYYVSAYGLAMAAPSVIVCVIWAALSTPTLLRVNPSLGSYYYTCSSPNSTVQNAIVPTLLVINGVIVVCNLYMAFLTRNVNSRYSETKLISLTIYNLAMTLIFAMSIIFSISLNYNLRAIIKIIAVFYVITFNIIATFTVKVYQCATSTNNTKSTTSLSQIGDGAKSQAAGGASTGALLDTGLPQGVGKNPKLPQSAAMVKPIGGLKGFLGESRKYYLRAESDYGLVLYPAIKRNIEDNKTSAACVGQCWNGSQANVIEVLVATPTELRVLMDQETYSITFDDEAVATVWNTYFQQWSLKAEGKQRAGGNA